MTPRISLAQLGARGHYALPVLLQRRGMLVRLFSDSVFAGPTAVSPGRLPTWLANTALARLLGRVAALPRGKVTAMHDLSWRSWWTKRQGRSWPDIVRADLDVGQAFAHRVADHLHNSTTAVYGYPTACLDLFEHARRRGMLTVLDQFCVDFGHLENLRRRELERWPDWETPPTAADTSVLARLQQRTHAERQLADLVVCPSGMVVRSLEGTCSPATRVKVVPRGLDTSTYQRAHNRPDHTGPLRVLYAGGVQVLKGVPYLLEAASRLGRSVVVRLAGRLNCRAEALHRMAGNNVQVLGQVPRDRMVDHYAWADVFCFPTLCDSFGFAPLEAMASGLPVVCTTAAGMADHIEHDVHGLLAPPASAEALAGALEKLVRHPELRHRMGRAAADRAAALTPARWGRTLVRLLEDLHARYR